MLLNTTQAAAYLTISPRSLATLRADGTGPAFMRVAPRQGVRYQQQALDEWLATRRTSTSQALA